MVIAAQLLVIAVSQKNIYGHSRPFMAFRVLRNKAPEAQIYGNSRLFVVIRVPTIIAPEARPIAVKCCSIAGNCCLKKEQLQFQKSAAPKHLRSFTDIRGHSRSKKKRANGVHLLLFTGVCGWSRSMWWRQMKKRLTPTTLMTAPRTSRGDTFWWKNQAAGAMISTGVRAKRVCAMPVEV